MPAIFGAALCTAVAAAPRTVEFRNGRWIELPDAAPATQPALEEPLALIQELVDAGRDREAVSRLTAWFKSEPNRASPNMDRALMMMGEALARRGNRILAFFYYDQLLDEHPESRLWHLALEKQFDIADAYLDGYRRRILYLPLVPAEDEAVEMLFRIQQRSPGSPLAERALLRTADYYYNDRQYDLAALTYDQYQRSYPRSPELPRVKLRQAFANLAQFRGMRFDATPLIDARAQLMDLVAFWPEYAEQVNAADVVRRIDETFARKAEDIGHFYGRTGSPGGAAYTFDRLVATYPDSEAAARAAKAIERLPSPAGLPADGAAPSDALTPADAPIPPDAKPAEPSTAPETPAATAPEGGSSATERP